MNSQKPVSSMAPRQCEISPPLTRARAHTLPGVMSTEPLFSSDRSMESSNTQQDLDPKSDPQNYSYPIPQDYHHQSILASPPPSTHGKPLSRPQIQRRYSVSMRLPPPADSTKKKNARKIPRPKNCFMAYRMDKQHEIMKKFPGVNNKDISRIVGKMWKQESNEEKEHYKAIAENLKKQHARQYPNYKFSPKKKAQKNLKKQEPSLVSTKFNSNEPDKCNSIFNTNMHDHILQHPPYTTTPAGVDDRVLTMGFPEAVILATLQQNYRSGSVDSIKSDSPFPVSSKYHADQYQQCMISSAHITAQNHLGTSVSPVQFEMRGEMDGMVSLSQISGYSNQNPEEEYGSCSEDYLSDVSPSETGSVQSAQSPLTQMADNVQIAFHCDQSRYLLHQDTMMPSMPTGGYPDELSFNSNEDNGFMKGGSDMGQNFLTYYSNVLYTDQDGILWPEETPSL